ncbi:hypothetical protein EMCRGX_G028759 [Ephydatia muelleri]
MDPTFKTRMTAIATSKAASAKSCVLSQEKFDAIVRHLSSPQDKVDPHFKHWVKSRHFQLADLPGLGLFKVLVIPNEGNNKEDGVKFLRVVHANQLCDIIQAVHADELKHCGYKKVLDYVSASWIFQQKIAAMKQDEGHAENKYPWVSWLPRIMFSMNCERHEGIRELPYRVVFGRYPPFGIFPGAEKHCIDEEDLPITSTCDNPHTASVHTETPIETAAPNSQLSPSIRDDENNDKGCESLISSGSCVAPQLASGHKDEMDAVDTDDEVEHSTFKLPSQVSNHADEQQEEEDDTGDEVEHSTFKLPSQVSNTHADEQQEEEDDGHSKATIHTAIRKKVCDNTYLAAAHMAVKYNKKKGVKTQVFSVGDKVTIGIPKMDRTKTDMPRLPCEITEVFGDKVKTYTLGTIFGTIKGKFRGGDLQSYDGSVPLEHGEITLSLREAAQKFNPCNKFTKSFCKCSMPLQASRAPLLSPADRALLDTTAWLSDMHMEAANVLLREAFPAVDGLQNPIFQQNMSFNVPSFEFVQCFLVNNNHWLVASNIGEEMDTVCIYDSMQTIPDEECISHVAKYVQCPNSHITIKVMNVQLQDNAYSCGEFAVAFATSLIYGEDPTHLHYKELRSHFKNCIDTFSITPFPSTVVNHQPRVVHQIRKRVYCKCRSLDNGKPMIRCCVCRQCFHPKCIGVSTIGAQRDKWKCPTCTETL